MSLPFSTEILKASGSSDKNVSYNGTLQIAKAMENPLRQGVMSGDILGNKFKVIPLVGNAPADFPLDWLAPGSENQHVAFAVPQHGLYPTKLIEGDRVTLPIYKIGNATSWALDYAEDARWDIAGSALSRFKDGFTKKLNDDGYHCILASAASRNIIVFDTDAAAGVFTKRLVSLLKLTTRRNGGGNSTSINKGKLTDLVLSPEGMEDMRNWNVDQVDEVTRREIFVSADGSLNRIFEVNLEVVDEFGEGQEYQNYAVDELGVSMGSDYELVVGFDLGPRLALVMPVRQELRIFPDDTLHREGRAGMYGNMRLGFGSLDNRALIFGSF